MPEDPDKHMRDFFGNYRDPMWDKMDEIKENMEVMKTSMPELEKKIADLEGELALEKRKTQAYVTYKGADAEQTVSNETDRFLWALLPNELFSI